LKDLTENPALNDLRINAMRALIPPAILMEEIPLAPEQADFVVKSRQQAQAILHGKDNRLVVVVGPCSIHDPEAAMDYARQIKPVADRLSKELLVIMRVYFEKPRTVVGWKGLINDPFIDGSFQINEGLRLSRKLLVDIAKLGLPAGTEFLDTIMPQFLSDLLAWAAIGARTTESQSHRELASGLSMPVGFKNGTDGQAQIAIDAIRAARVGHWFTSITKQGVSAIFSTIGNDDCHLILRGGKKTGPNYQRAQVEEVAQRLESAGLKPRLMVDFSHGNSEKDFNRQKTVCADVCEQIRSGSESIFGVMIESNLVEGRQDYKPGIDPVYGQSITDPCLSLKETIPLLEDLAAAVRVR